VLCVLSHLFPQPPQSVIVVVGVSQPSSAVGVVGSLQFANPPVHVEVHTPDVHASDETLLDEHARPQAPHDETLPSTQLSLPVSTTPVSMPVSIPVSTPVSMPVSIPVSMPVSMPVSRPVSRPVSTPLSMITSASASSIVESRAVSGSTSDPASFVSVDESIESAIESEESVVESDAASAHVPPGQSTSSSSLRPTKVAQPDTPTKRLNASEKPLRRFHATFEGSALREEFARTNQGATSAPWKEIEKVRSW